MSCEIVINQQTSLPVLDKVTPEAKVEDRKCVQVASKGRENYMKKLKDRLLKDNKMMQMTSKEFIDYFQQDLNGPASIPIAIEEEDTVRRNSTYNKSTILK